MLRYLVLGLGLLLLAGCGATAPQDRIQGTWVGTTNTKGDSSPTAVQFIFLDGDLITQKGDQRTIGSYRVFQADREGLDMKVWVGDEENEELAIYDIVLEHDTLIIEQPDGDIILRRKIP